MIQLVYLPGKERVDGQVNADAEEAVTIESHGAIKFTEVGIEFHDNELGMNRCVTFDKLSMFNVTGQVTDEMRTRSAKLQVANVTTRTTEGRNA